MTAELDPGARIGRFVVTRRLGEGGMGTVVEARDSELGRAVALKFLRDQKGDTIRLLREAQALATLSHPNVVAVYELGTHGGHVFIAMELVDGITLDRVLAEKPLGWREIVALFLQVGRGLSAVHQQGMVHRDVKPSNVFVDRTGRVRVGDLGLASRDPLSGAPSASGRASGGGGGGNDDAVDAGAGLQTTADDRTSAGEVGTHLITPGAAHVLGTPLTRTGAVLGTPRYMAPEQHGGERATHRADQFAFCVALWEAVYGEHPFGAVDATSLRAAVLDGRLRRPTRASAAPRRMEQLLTRGLARDPAARWPSMPALLDELERLSRPARRPWLLATAALMLAAIGIYLVFLRSAGPARDECEGLAAPMFVHWTPSIRADAKARLGDAPYAPDDLAAFDAFATRWVDLRRAACRGTRDAAKRTIAEWQSACLDEALRGFDHAVATPPWLTDRWGHIRPDLPSLSRCARPAPDRPPVVTTVGNRKRMLAMALSPDGAEVAMADGTSLQIVSTKGSHSVQLSPDVAALQLVRWPRPRELHFMGRDVVDVVDPVTGSLLATHPVRGGAEFLSDDLAFGLVADDRGWGFVDMVTGARAALTVPDANNRIGPSAWSPDGRRLAVVAAGRRGREIVTLLRIIDIGSRTSVDEPIRLEHELTGGLSIAWLDAERVALNGRVRADHGEGIWVASIAPDGSVAEWEQRLFAPASVSYACAAASAGRLLAESSGSSTSVIRIRGSHAEVVSDGVPAMMIGSLSVHPDGKRVLVTTDRGPAYVTIATGAFASATDAAHGSTSLDPSGRLIWIDRDRLVMQLDNGAVRELLTGLDDTSILTCAGGGGACAIWSKNTATSTVRVLGDDWSPGGPITIARELIDLAVSPDRSQVAATGWDGALEVTDVRSGRSARWAVPSKDCPGPPRLESVVWARSGSAVFVTQGCKGGITRLVRATADGPGVVVFEQSGWFGNLATSTHDEVFAVTRRWDSQAALVDGM